VILHLSVFSYKSNIRFLRMLIIDLVLKQSFVVSFRSFQRHGSRAFMNFFSFIVLFSDLMT
jgi:hypothetical protein